ncbi:MAG: lysophospholipase [Gemmatimonadetes bacterium]|nr:lysophospholipase [Gemmatimonadota bacterium]
MGADPVDPVVRARGYLEGVGDLRLHYVSWELAAPRAALLVVHGHGEHAGRYAIFAEAMARRGFSVFAYSQRGHGRSEGRRGHADRLEVLLQDLDRFRREVEGIAPRHTPLVLVGHSFGGLVAIRYLQEYPCAWLGAVISAPWLGTRVPIPGWKRALGALLLHTLPAMPVHKPMHPELLSHDPEAARAYREDPLVHHTITARLFAEVTANMAKALEQPERIRCPLLFLVPGADGVTDPDVSLRFARSVSYPDVTVCHYPGQYHELFNELVRDEVYETIASWMDARLGARDLQVRIAAR